ncbi:hypothetical protein BU23DRAFT_163055 [Bimuria novae-zelandiae CBS 107.79]|uniref:Uncharacterized protein n=1 Tax=Bimuria novae-zelandiae CBS 107.79 TaxID=1447943 RepID=A0A6A5V816_9PLEO|nr:hypothetical protein BU23DRAFT_163055 [Bimuria novae-zelandiae CBS 107.79]
MGTQSREHQTATVRWAFYIFVESCFGYVKLYFLSVRRGNAHAVVRCSKKSSQPYRISPV